MTTISLVLPVITTSTLAVIIFIGLGFLPAPSRATALWSAGFSCVMIGAYVWLAHDMSGLIQLRALGSGFMIAPMALMWSGLRAYRAAARQFVPLSIAFMIVLPVLLTLASFTDAYGVVFRVAFVATAVFAALTIIELVRLGTQQRDEALPLIAASALFIAAAVVTIVDGMLTARHLTGNPDGLGFLRTFNLISANVYVICNLVTALLLTTRTVNKDKAPHGAFERTARNRLNRAEAANDTWWSMLDIRLDDPDLIRAASSTPAFKSVSERFARDVDIALPADADIEQMSATRILALVPRAQGGVRECVADLLGRISTVEERQAVPIRLSASVGWAQVQAVGYEFDELVTAAAASAQVAQANGGDRWERVPDAVT